MSNYSPEINLNLSESRRGNRNLILVSLLIIFVFAVTLLLIYTYYLNSTTENQAKEDSDMLLNTVPQDSYNVVFPNVSYSIDADGMWRLKVFQPILKEFVSENGNNYLVVEYDEGSTKVSKRVFVTSNNTEYLDRISFKEGDNLKLVTFDELKQLLNTEGRISISYFETTPTIESLTDDFCSNLVRRCALARLDVEYKSYFISSEVIEQ